MPKGVLVYEFDVGNPLKENCYYGNGFYENPSSKFYDREYLQHRVFSWSTVKVRVGYVPVNEESAQRLRKEYEVLSEGTMIDRDANSTVSELQHEIVIETKSEIWGHHERRDKPAWSRE
jgi:hypothetical protein